MCSWLDYDGYLFFRGLLPREDVLALRRAILEICARAGWLRRGTDPMDAVADGSKACVEPEPAFLAVYREVQRLEPFHTFAHRPEILSLMHKVLDGDALPHPAKICRLSFPKNTEHTTPAHQDYPFIQGAPQTYTAWIPLGDYAQDHGGLKVNAGTHKQGVFEHHLSLGAGGMGINVDSLPDNWHTIEYQAGDLLLFHSHLVHQALPNLTPDRLRLSVDYRYQAMSAAIAESNLKPHTGAITWDEVYAGWSSTEHQYYWTAQRALKTTSLDMALFEQRDREAFAAAERRDPVARAALLRIAQRDPSPERRAQAERALAALESRATDR